MKRAVAVRRVPAREKKPAPRVSTLFEGVALTDAFIASKPSLAAFLEQGPLRRGDAWRMAYTHEVYWARAVSDVEQQLMDRLKQMAKAGG